MVRVRVRVRVSVRVRVRVRVSTSGWGSACVAAAAVGCAGSTTRSKTRSSLPGHPPREMRRVWSTKVVSKLPYR